MHLFRFTPRSQAYLLLVACVSYGGLCAGQNATNTIWLLNTANHPLVLDEMVSQGSQLVKVNSVRLDPGQKEALGFWPGQSGFIAAENASGQLQWNASRLEFSGINSDFVAINVSYIDGRNASITLDDGMGHQKGDPYVIAAGAPANALSYDQAGWPTIAGWYDGQSAAGRDGGWYIQQHIPCGSAYIHPDDYRDLQCNPMTMGYDPSHNYYVNFGNP